MHASWPAEYVLLGLLCERPAHGYELYHQVAGDPVWRAIWRIERSEVYFLLRKLSHARYVEPVGSAEQGAGPPRAVYQATASGRAALDAWITSPEPQPRSLRHAFMAKLYLAYRASPHRARALLRSQQQALEEWAEHHQPGAGRTGFAQLIDCLRVNQALNQLTTIKDMGQLLEGLPPSGVAPPTVDGRL